MTTLYIDTTYDITLGLLDDAMSWTDLRHFKSQKASSTLQVEAHKLLSDFKIDPKNLTNIVTVAGPGFYTGLRLSEGFADVFQFFNVNNLSFYSYDIPKWCGFKSGVWITKAYRGEYFFHHWDGAESKDVLISAAELADYLKPLTNIFIHSATSLDEKLSALMGEVTSTNDLLRSHADKIFTNIFPNSKKESFYFRAPEDEFRVAK